MSRPCLHYEFCFGPWRWFFYWRRLLEFFFNFSAKVMNFCHTKVPLIFLGDVSMTTFFFYLNLKIRHVMAIDDQELLIILAVSCHRKSLRNCIFFPQKARNSAQHTFNGTIYSHITYRLRFVVDWIWTPGFPLQWRLDMIRLSERPLNQIAKKPKRQLAVTHLSPNARR